MLYPDTAGYTVQHSRLEYLGCLAATKNAQTKLWTTPSQSGVRWRMASTQENCTIDNASLTAFVDT